MEFIPAAAPNYKVGRDGNSVRFIIIHTVVGTQNSAIVTFQNPSRIASAHYIVDKWTSRVVQMVRESDIAYHAGNWTINTQSIGIEHADDGDYNGPRPDILYATSAALVADICKRYGIPCNRDYIKKHLEVSLTGTACPDALDIDRIVRQAAVLLTPPPAPTPPAPVPTAIVKKYTKFSPAKDMVLNKTANLWDFNKTGWSFTSVKTLAKGEQFVAVGEALHSNGGTYYMTAYSFGNADTTGVPTHTWGVNKVDLDEKPIPTPTPVPDPVPTPVPTPTPTPTPIPTPPSDTTDTNAFLKFIKAVLDWLSLLLGKKIF
jgi:hypothetical protein